MRNQILITMLIIAPAQPLWAASGSASNDEIIVLGRGLPLPPGTPAYGSTVIDREDLLNSTSGNIETVLSDVAGFQQARICSTALLAISRRC